VPFLYFSCLLQYRSQQQQPQADSGTQHFHYMLCWGVADGLVRINSQAWKQRDSQTNTECT
jgi:hypothetical protein